MISTRRRWEGIFMARGNGWIKFNDAMTIPEGRNNPTTSGWTADNTSEA